MDEQARARARMPRRGTDRRERAAERGEMVDGMGCQDYYPL
jgi:hypothetical protein